MFVSVLLREVRVFFRHAPVPSHSVGKVMYFIYQLSNYHVSGMFLNLTNFRAENFQYNRIWHVTHWKG